MSFDKRLVLGSFGSGLFARTRPHSEVSSEREPRRPGSFSNICVHLLLHSTARSDCTEFVNTNEQLNLDDISSSVHILSRYSVGIHYFYEQLKLTPSIVFFVDRMMRLSSWILNDYKVPTVRLVLYVE